MGKDLVFNSNWEPAKPSLVIMKILTDKMRDKRLAVIREDIGFMVNQDVYDEIDEYIERLISNRENSNIKQNPDGTISPVDPTKPSSFNTDTQVTTAASPDSDTNTKAEKNANNPSELPAGEKGRL